MIKYNFFGKFVSIFITIIFLFVSHQIPAKANSLTFDETKNFLTKDEESLWRYKMNKITVQVEGDSWYIIQGINTQLTDTEFLRLVGNTDIIKERLKKFDIREPIGAVFAVLGILVIIVSALMLTDVLKITNNNLLYGSIGALGGISFVVIGDAISPLGVMETSEHILTIEEARYITDIYNTELRKFLNITSEQ